jgi:hypothetical protein
MFRIGSDWRRAFNSQKLIELAKRAERHLTEL